MCGKKHRWFAAGEGIRNECAKKKEKEGREKAWTWPLADNFLENSSPFKDILYPLPSVASQTV